MYQYGIITESPKMKHVFQIMEAISKTSTTVLLTGETGTGKELVAQAIHHTSTRSQKPFVAINCGAIPSDLMERELFGHEKGSFTGANQKAIGKLEFANGGTIFLDEIATLPPHLQVKLLRVIQEKSFEPVGSLISVKVDVRFIAAANVNLLNEVKEGRFREDLYYRLNVLPIDIPPLRDRREDIPLLVQHYLSEYGKKYNKRIGGITDRALDILTKYSWFGNVRELQNLSEMLVVLAAEDSIIDADFLPETLFKSNVNKPAVTYEDAMKAFEKEYLIKVLQETNWNRTEASKKMGLHRNTLLNKMREHGLQEAH
ncbi:MAG: sigma-54-dependent Fis family transcriptional regulator [Deltaproteobacteria bacterium]|nr:sigma-54-dependent Fis family transcriptional regulator [Deltaproteobacteria bacterium]MBZ0219193.1 sigma-54 dependent transcriptional regulator [Deltaproteobacteria bacterium]